MIGQHPDLAGLPELKLFGCRAIGELEASLPQFLIDRGVTHRSPGLVRALAEFEFGGQTAQSLAAARAWLQDRLDWPGSDVLDVLLERLSRRIAVEKSPDNLLTDTGLAGMAAAYPRARYLHLTRHPVTTQRSIQGHLNRTIPSYRQNGEPMSGIGSWYDIHRRILLFAANLPADHYLRVRAEDVLNDTESQLHAITAWLGIRSIVTRSRPCCTRNHHPLRTPGLRRAALPVETTRASYRIPSPTGSKSPTTLSRRQDGLQTRPSGKWLPIWRINSATLTFLRAYRHRWPW
jgi:hypothetical protein